MTILIVGLVLFLGTHSIRIWGEPLREGVRAKIGAGAWKGLYSLLAIAGLAAMVWGYGEARQTPQIVFMTPFWMRHLTALLMFVALVLFAAAYVPRTRIKSVVRHPMTLGTAVWAFAHLLVNGTVADLLMFGGILAWAAVLYPVALRRDAKLGTKYPAIRSWSNDLVAVAAGAMVWAMLVFGIHQKLFGVPPLMIGAR